MLPSKQSFLLARQTRQEQTSMMRLRANTLAPVMAEVRGTGAERNRVILVVSYDDVSSPLTVRCRGAVSVPCMLVTLTR